MKMNFCWIGLIIAILVGIFANFNGFLMGYTPSVWGIITSLAYVLCWVLFVMQARHCKGRDMQFSVIWSGLTLICAVMFLIQSLYADLMLSFIIPLAFVCITPLYPFSHMLSHSGMFLGSLVFTVVSLIWLIISVIFLRRKNK